MGKHKKPTKKKVSIIIPFYGQTESELSIPLASINNQIGIDFTTIDIHLVNDGGAAIDSSKFDIFENLGLHYHELPENVGPGLARQYGIDHSEGDYVMFVDSDDTLNILDALAGFFMAIEQLGDHQMIASSFVVQEEMLHFTDKFSYRVYAPDSDISHNAVYGKWFRRIFLKKIGLRFRPELKSIYEDTYFSGLAMQLMDDAIQINQTTYMRRYNKRSLTHASDYQENQPLDLFVVSNRLKLEKIREMRPDILTSCIENALVSSFLFAKKCQTTDESKFWQEFRQLLAEFPYDTEANFLKLKLLAEKFSRTAQGIYENVDTSDLAEFLKKV